MHGLLSRFFELAMDEVHRYEGTVNQLLGDGFMALFGAPIVHENHARRAVLAAIDLQRTLRDHHEQPGGLSIVHSVLHGDTLPDHVEQMIIDKAAGNPFFLEELTRAVIEHGDTEINLDVPGTMQGVLMARSDRLSEPHKQLLQAASVLG